MKTGVKGLGDNVVRIERICNGCGQPCNDHADDCFYLEMLRKRGNAKVPSRG